MRDREPPRVQQLAPISRQPAQNERVVAGDVQSELPDAVCIRDGMTAGLLGRYAACTRNPNAVLAAIDEERAFRWLEKEVAGEFLDYRLHAMFYSSQAEELRARPVQ